jgi:hypothetical protein
MDLEDVLVENVLERILIIVLDVARKGLVNALINDVIKRINIANVLIP